MLAEKLKPPKRARNPPHNWVEKSRRRERETEGIRTGIALLRGSCGREKEPTPWEATLLTGRSAEPRNFKVSEKSRATGLRRAKQSESHTDHLHQCPRWHSPRRSGGGWSLRLRLQSSVRGRRLGLGGWRQPEGLGSGAPQDGEPKTTG